MLDFVNHYYEVTEDNIDQLRQLIIDEDIRDPYGSKLILEYALQVGHVFGNINTNNPKQTKCWWTKDDMSASELEKLTTELPKVLMTIE